MAAERDRLPSAIVQAASDRRGGATEVARRALDGLLEIAGDPGLLALAAEVLLEGQPAMAPIWHLAGAARSDDPAAALAGLRERLDHDGAAAVEVAASWVRKWLDKRPGPVATVSHSSQVNAVLQHLGQRVVVAEAGRRNAVVALVGSDAIGPKALLNAAGTRRLAARLPTLVVSTPLKLVPAGVFARLAAPGFEVVPLDLVTAVALGPELLAPAAAGPRRWRGVRSAGRPAAAARDRRRRPRSPPRPGTFTAGRGDSPPSPGRATAPRPRRDRACRRRPARRGCRAPRRGRARPARRAGPPGRSLRSRGRRAAGAGAPARRWTPGGRGARRSGPPARRRRRRARPRSSAPGPTRAAPRRGAASAAGRERRCRRRPCRPC